MEQQLYIPKEITVGYQKRGDTFTKKLAYVIYTDDKGVLRKEKSWESWRDNKLGRDNFENVPTSGFMLNKNVERYNWGHFSSNRSYIRVHDPRGFEFEISPENLIGILMEGDCNRRVLDGEFVYSWHTTELVLLPVGTEAYKASQSYTKLQAVKLTARDMVPGLVYRTKKMDEYVYLGKHNWSSVKHSYTVKGSCEKASTEKRHIFMMEGALKSKYDWERRFHTVTSLSSFAEKVSDVPSPEYAEMIEKLAADPHISEIDTVAWKKIENPVSRIIGKNAGEWIKVGYVKDPVSQKYSLWSIWNGNSYSYSKASNAITADDNRSFDLTTDGLYALSEDGKLEKEVETSRNYYSWSRPKKTLDDLRQLEFYEIELILKNGKKKNVFDLTTLFPR